MRNLTEQLDKVASQLEARGHADLALELDSVTNALEKQAGVKEWFLKAKDQIAKFLGPHVLTKEKALDVLRQHNIHQIDQNMVDNVLKGVDSEGAKNAGFIGSFLQDVLKNPVKIALISLALAAGSVNAADINKMVSLMPMPSHSQMSLLETGVAPLWAFKSQFKSMVENNMDKDTPLGRYVHERLKAGDSADQLVKDLVKALEIKLKDPSNKGTLDKLNKYLESKDIKDTADNYLEPLVQEVAQNELKAC
jgi:uncharacterized membrane protein YheB (UPF0754 family)